MSKGDHQLVKLFQKQLSSIETILQAHKESCPNAENLAALSEEMNYLYKLAKTFGERMRELSLFRGMVTSLRQENARLRSKTKEPPIEEVPISQDDQEIPLPVMGSRFSTQRIDILNKKNLTSRQNKDLSYPQEVMPSLPASATPEGAAEGTRSGSLTNRFPIISGKKELPAPEQEKKDITQVQPVAENSAKAALLKLFKEQGVTETTVLPLLQEPGEGEKSPPTRNPKKDSLPLLSISEENLSLSSAPSLEEEAAWPKPSVRVVRALKEKPGETKETPAILPSSIAVEKKSMRDHELQINLDLTPEESDVTVKFPEESIFNSAPQKTLQQEKKYLEEGQVLKLLQIEKPELEQMIERGEIHRISREGKFFFDGEEIQQLRSRTMELETIMMEKKKMKKTMISMKKLYHDRME